MSVEDLLLENFDRFKINNPQREGINLYLSLLKQKHVPTYEHCIRVGDISRRIAECFRDDQKAAWYVGTLHDVGKALIDKSLLDKKEKFSDKDMDEMRWHPIYSHKLLRDVFDFSAEGALRHHRYQRNYYPVELPLACKVFSAGTLIVAENCSKIVSIADFYDALTTRNNDKYKEEKERLNSGEILVKAFPDEVDRINLLFEKRILI